MPIQSTASVSDQLFPSQQDIFAGIKYPSGISNRLGKFPRLKARAETFGLNDYGVTWNQMLGFPQNAVDMGWYYDKNLGQAQKVRQYFDPISSRQFLHFAEENPHRFAGGGQPRDFGKNLIYGLQAWLPNTGDFEYTPPAAAAPVVTTEAGQPVSETQPVSAAPPVQGAIEQQSAPLFANQGMVSQAPSPLLADTATPAPVSPWSEEGLLQQATESRQISQAPAPLLATTAQGHPGAMPGVSGGYPGGFGPGMQAGIPATGPTGPPPLEPLEPGQFRSLTELLPGPVPRNVMTFVPGRGMVTLPQPMYPEFGGQTSLENRAIQIGTEDLRRRSDWSVPGAETGPYAEREGWSTRSDEWIRNYIAGQSASQDWEDENMKEWRALALAEQSEQLANYARAKSETQAAQNQSWALQNYFSTMGQLRGFGQSAIQEAESSRERLLDRTAAMMEQSGRVGSNAMLMSMRNAENFARREQQRTADEVFRVRFGAEQQVSNAVSNAMLNVAYNPPDMNTIANILLQAGAAPSGAQARAGGGSASGAAGMGLAMGLGGAALGASLAGGAGAAGAGAGAAGASSCCFCHFFLEGRHGDGTLDWVVRRYRDEHMTPRNSRGYYKSAEVLVPLMRKSWMLKMLVLIFCIQPLFWYGRWKYREEIKQRGERLKFGGRFGWLFKPVKNFWMKMWDYLGQDHPYVRFNGEIV